MTPLPFASDRPRSPRASLAARCWCRSAGGRAPRRLDKLTFLTDWRAQAEHGGYYQAVAAGLYNSAGLESTCARAVRTSTPASSCSPVGST